MLLLVRAHVHPPDLLPSAQRWHDDKRKAKIGATNGEGDNKEDKKNNKEELNKGGREERRKVSR